MSFCPYQITRPDRGTEPLYFFVVMVVDASRPLQTVMRLADASARVSPLPTQRVAAWLGLEEVPLLGSLIAEPAAMTIAALLLALLVMSLEDLGLT